MADSISSSIQLTVQVETKTNATTSETKKVNLIVPNPKSSLTESTIKTAVKNVLVDQTTDQNGLYIYTDNDGNQYIFSSSSDAFSKDEQILTAYTTAETITVVDIGVED